MVKKGQQLVKGKIDVITEIEKVSVGVTKLTTYQTTVGTSAVQLTVNPTPADKGVLVKAMSINTGIIYVGKLGVTTSTGFELTAGEAVCIEVENANLIYVIASAASQKVCWVVI